MPLFREWKLPEMVLQSAGTPWQSRGTIRIFADSRVEIRFTYSHPIVHSVRVPETPVITGSTSDGFTLAQTKAVFVRSEHVTRRTTDLVYLPYRCVLSVPKARPLSSARYYIKNLSPYAGTATMNDGELEARLVPEGVYEPFQFGARLDVTGRRLARLKADKLAEDVARLVTVAARCPCVPSLREYYSSSDLQRIEFFPNGWDYKPVRSIIPLVGDNLERFISQSLPNLRATASTLSTPLLIEYFWRAHQETTAELKFLLSSVFMEAVKFHYALNVARHTKNMKSTGVIRNFLKPTGGAWSFEDLLTQVAQHLKIPNIKRRTGFIENRNCIFHSGQSSYSQLGRRQTYPPLKAELWRLYDLMDEFMLRILGYKGPFFAFRDMERLRMFPSRRPWRPKKLLFARPPTS